MAQVSSTTQADSIFQKRQKNLLSYFLDSINEINERFDRYIDEEDAKDHGVGVGGGSMDNAVKQDEMNP